MSLLTKRVINDNRDSLMNDLQGDVILYSRSILSEDEFRTISSLGDDRKMIEIFLNTMINSKSEEQLKIFVEGLKNYYPWLHKGLNETILHLKTTDPLFTVKTLGGIPNLPQRIIKRTNLLNKVKTSLEKLSQGEYLVLHGMLGSGKTTLAASALHDIELVKSCFKGTVYWLTVGKVGEEDLGYLQQELNERFPNPIYQLSPLVHLATIQLTKTLIERGWNDCLIVLDDVRNRVVIDCFAIRAKFLVITEDKGVIGSHPANFIKVDEGFSQAETLELFSKSLNIKEHSLPQQALSIYEYTKGHPLTISLIASQLENFKDDLSTENRWNYYVNMLGKKTNRRKSLNNLETFYGAIHDSVESLGEKYEHFFWQLSVFADDVNIKPEVLGVLWKLDKFEAEEIMVNFVRKSLAVMKWNEVQKSYVYGVHDLVSGFLKKDLSDTQIKALHQNLIYNYQTSCNGVWCKLPDDNYIFYYIGYHLKKAGLYHLFKSLYLNLPFLEAKVRLCGPTDLIKDFKNYKELITDKDPDLEKKVEEFSVFIEYNGLSIAQGIDIIQAALNEEPKSSSVHVAAVQLAQSKASKQLYLHTFPLSRVERVILPELLEIHEEIKIVCFGASINEVIVVHGGSSKTLQLYNIRSKGVLKKFNGHTGKIQNLDVSECRTQFLSTSLDNTVRVWSLENDESSSGDRTPSPSERQSDYMNLFNINHPNSNRTDNALSVLRHNHPLLWGVFSKKRPSLICSLTYNGSICVWDHGIKKWEAKHDSLKLECLDFLDNDNLIAAGGKDKVILFFKETGTVERMLSCKDFISLRSLPGSLGGGLVILMKNQFTRYCRTTNENDPHFSPLPTGLAFTKLHCVGTNIAVTTESGELYIFHFLNGSVVAHFPSMPRQASTICVNDRAMLSGYSDGSLYLYPLEGLPCPLTSIKWKLGHDPVLVKMDHSHENIEVVIGFQKFVIAERSTMIKMADVSRDGKVIVVAIEGGQVIYKHLDQDQEVIFECNEIPVKLYLLENDSEKFVVALYEKQKAVLWKASERKLVKLDDKRSIGCLFANLLQLESYFCIITAFPMTIWTLDGDRIDSMLPEIGKSVKPFCVSPNFKSFVYIAGDKTWLVESGHKIMNLDVTANKIITFSPSSKILALFSFKGILTIFNCQIKKPLVIRQVTEDITCLAVSDSGSVCFGGSDVLSIITLKGLSSKIVLNTRSIVAKPTGEDWFTVADNSGIVYVVYLDVIKSEEDIRIGSLNLVS